MNTYTYIHVKRTHVYYMIHASMNNAVIQIFVTTQIRFVSTVSPLEECDVSPFSARKGLIWVGSAHFDNQKAVEFVARFVLPLVRTYPHFYFHQTS